MTSTKTTNAIPSPGAGPQGWLLTFTDVFRDVVPKPCSRWVCEPPASMPNRFVFLARLLVWVLWDLSLGTGGWVQGCHWRPDPGVVRESESALQQTVEVVVGVGGVMRGGGVAECHFPWPSPPADTRERLRVQYQHPYR